jgi:hypothetical protein
MPSGSPRLAATRAALNRYARHITRGWLWRPRRPAGVVVVILHDRSTVRATSQRSAGPRKGTGTHDRHSR